jgi:flagellar hook-associated protein 2
MATVSSTSGSTISSLIPTAAPATASATSQALKDAVAQTLTTSLGAGQFDVPTIAKALATADVANKRQDYATKQSAGQIKLNGYNTLTQALQSIQTGLADLNKPATFNGMAVTASDATAVSATATGKPSAGVYDLMVSQRAQAHTLASIATPSQYTALGTGTLNLTVGGTTKAITVDASNNTLQGLKSAINAAGLPVNASIVNDGSGYRLVLAGQQTGLGNAISLDAVDGDGNNTDTTGISQFAFGNGTNNMTQTIAAQDAQFTVNGLSLSSPTNTATGVIDGLSLSLNKAQPGVHNTVTVGSDTTNLSTKIESFVDDLNAMRDVINYLGSYKKDPNDPNKGSLAGDAALKQVQSKMREFLQFHTTAPGAVQSMADIGIKTNLDGTLALDKTKLESAISADPAAIGRLFSATATATDNQVTYTASSDKTVEGKYNLNIVQAARQALYLGNAATGSATDPITITAGNNDFALTVNGTTTNSLSLAAGTYSRSSLAQMMQSAINNDTNLKAKGITVQVSFDATNNRYQMSTDKFGSASTVNFTSINAALSDDMGLVTGAGATGSYAGLDVMGSLDKDGSSYTFVGKGQSVKISSFLTGSPRDLEFDVAGNATGARGTLDFRRGFASQMTKSITDMFDAKNGAIGSRVANLNKKDTDYTAQLAKVETRYEQLLAQYTKQFSIVNETISSMNSLKTTLSQTFKA